MDSSPTEPKQGEDAGSTAHLQNLFRHDRAGSPENGGGLHRKRTKKGSNTSSSRSQNSTETTALLGNHRPTGSFVSTNTDHVSTPSYDSSALSSLFQSPASEKTPKAGPGTRKYTAPTALNEKKTPFRDEEPNGLPARAEKDTPIHTRAIQLVLDSGHELMSPSTWIGAFMFVLYHAVFVLAFGSSVSHREHAKNSVLGLITKMGALGIFGAGPVYLYNIGNDLPGLYPTCDLFLAPIFSSITQIIDNDLAQYPTISDRENDEIFLLTFAFIAFIAMGLSGCLLVLAGVFRLANLGAFLPFPVLCGFFSAVGILTWHLGFLVDTSGKSFSAVFLSGDTSLMMYALLHHIPGVFVAVTMKYLGPKNPFYVVALVFATIASVYGVLLVTGTSLEEAREQGWFWHYDEIVYKKMSAGIGFQQWLPPAPFGMVNGLLTGRIHWPSVVKGLQPACALSFLYLIRCALHSAAFLKNVPNLGRAVKVVKEESNEKRASLALPTASAPRKKTRMEKFSEMVDIEDVFAHSRDNGGATTEQEIEKAKPVTWSLQGILIQYGLAQLVSACIGGFGVIPSVATSHAMFSLRAERVAPQLGSFAFIAIFYITDFRIIAFVPKMAFSCLLTLAFIDITLTWFIRSYFKTKEKLEWLVVPLIVGVSFAVGLLEAVFLGIGLSTFIFVAAFFRSGVVKFAASGKDGIRSTIERPAANAQWLDEHGDLIQVVILQNYLFFGNASSILEYISTMFEDPKPGEDQNGLPPKPKFVVVDMALVTGMDTSTVTVVADIISLCDRNGAKLFVSGASPNLRSVLALGGVKPLGGDRSKRKLRFFKSLDIAIGKAEDNLLDIQLHQKGNVSMLPSLGEESGFQIALRGIDEQHGTTFAKDLAGLEDYTTPIALEPEESLYDSPSRPERGLFFIEEGILKIERDSTLTANTRSLASLSSLRGQTKKSDSVAPQQFVRLGRFGVGWVVGTVEAVSGMEKAGVHLAVTACKLHYLSYSRMEELEAKNPVLTLRLYKLLANMVAKRHDLAVGQLGILHAIISSPAQNKPLGRKASATFQGL